MEGARNETFITDCSRCLEGDQHTEQGFVPRGIRRPPGSQHDRRLSDVVNLRELAYVDHQEQMVQRLLRFCFVHRKRADSRFGRDTYEETRHTENLLSVNLEDEDYDFEFRETWSQVNRSSAEYPIPRFRDCDGQQQSLPSCTKIRISPSKFNNLDTALLRKRQGPCELCQVLSARQIRVCGCGTRRVRDIQS